MYKVYKNMAASVLLLHFAPDPQRLMRSQPAKPARPAKPAEPASQASYAKDPKIKIRS